MPHSHRAAIVARPIARLSPLLPASSARRPPSGERGDGPSGVGRSFGRAGEVAVYSRCLLATAAAAATAAATAEASANQANQAN